jgi:hypothetical protein
MMMAVRGMSRRTTTTARAASIAGFLTRSSFMMKLPAAHEAAGNIGGLEHRTLGRRMSGSIAGDGDHNSDAEVRVLPPQPASPVYTASHIRVGRNL